MPQQSETVEGRLADLIETNEVYIGDYHVSGKDRGIIVKALRDRARWMAADVSSGERREGRSR